MLGLQSGRAIYGYFCNSCCKLCDRREDSITAGLIPRSLLRKELFQGSLEAVIPECFYRESRRDRNWTPIKTFGGDPFG
jgi:hypothetical protein